ncbi:MAG: glycerol-3-phosphate acyltransferase [Dehalococcoidia bacterium]|nr:glycerol-3-phosphate acyltransferase [Dehalococcoidia bacterium]
MYVEFGLLVVAAYLVGSIPAAYLMAKAYYGTDLRKFGSGNVGVSNLFRATSSKWLTAVVIIWDMGKGALVTWAAKMFGLTTAQYVIVGLTAIAGHNWSVFLNFSAGRGILATAGVALYLMPWATLIICFIALSLRLAALPVLCLVAALSLASWLTGEPMAVTWGLLAIWFMTVIRRLTAPRTADVPFDRELLINRFLFDRDIKDAKEWVTRKIDREAINKQKRTGGNP